jgi:hypothetical protein
MRVPSGDQIGVLLDAAPVTEVENVRSESLAVGRYPETPPVVLGLADGAQLVTGSIQPGELSFLRAG